MTNPPRIKGTRAESASATWLTDELGVSVTRGPLRGNQDRGDLFGVPDWTLEVKNTKLPNLKAWGREIAAEQRNAGTSHAALLWSPPGVGMAHVEDWIVFDYDLDDERTRIVPHIGPLNRLHKYVAVMDGWSYTVDVDGLCLACRASTWVAGVRERMAQSALEAAYTPNVPATAASTATHFAAVPTTSP